MLGWLASPEFSSVLFFGVVIIFFLPALVWSVVLHHKTPAQSGRIAGIPFKVRVHPPDEVGLVRTADWTGSEKDLNTRRTKNPSSLHFRFSGRDWRAAWHQAWRLTGAFSPKAQMAPDGAIGENLAPVMANKMTAPARLGISEAVSAMKCWGGRPRWESGARISGQPKTAMEWR